MELLSADMLRSSMHGQLFRYSVDRYPFKEIVETLLGVDLGEIHQFLGDFKRFERVNDQNTLAHKVFYSNYNKSIRPLYEDFIANFVAHLIPFDFYFQSIPTFRIGIPGNTFVGEYHKDSMYNHQPYEINFNLGLSNYTGNSSLRVERLPGCGDFINLESPYGTIFSFDHIDCLHGSEPNDTQKTMVSFDFRLALKDLYFPSELSSINMHSTFSPGSYFSSKLIKTIR